MFAYFINQTKHGNKRTYIFKYLKCCENSFKRNRPIGPNGHPGIRDSTLTSCQKGSELNTSNKPLHRIKKNYVSSTTGATNQSLGRLTEKF